MNSQLSSLLYKLLKIIFPPFCVCCKKNGSVLCEKCYQLIHFNLQPSIPIKNSCQFLDQTLVLAAYQPPVSQLIKALKYQRVRAVSDTLAELLYLHLTFPSFDLITSAPISRKRANERGFNQAQLISEKLGLMLNKPTEQLLIKIKDTEKQAQSNYQQRLCNLNDCFQVDQKFKHLVKKSVILIVDDVISTGSTLNECAKTLKTAEAKKVIGVALAQGL
mgnify:CR=1 FL=1